MRLTLLLICGLVLIGTGALGQAADRVQVRCGAAGPQLAGAIAHRYASIPKGVVLEGTAEGIEELKSVAYDKEKDEFVINEKMRYKNPVTRKEFAQIFKALRKDDRMGMTLMEGQPRVYGPLSADSNIVKQMIETDKLLGGIAYGFDWLLEGIKLPGAISPSEPRIGKSPSSPSPASPTISLRSQERPTSCRPAISMYSLSRWRKTRLRAADICRTQRRRRST